MNKKSKIVSSIYNKYCKGGKMKYDTGGNFVSYDAYSNNPYSTPEDAPKQNTGWTQAISTVGNLAQSTQNYNNSPNKDMYKTEDAVWDTVGQIGPVGAIIGGVADLGNTAFRPMRESNEKKAGTSGYSSAQTIAGGIFNPLAALQTRGKYEGGYTDISGKGYENYLAKLNKQKQFQENIHDFDANMNQHLNQIDYLQSRPTMAYGGNLPGDDKTKVYTNKAEYDKALQAYNDSLNLYNFGVNSAAKLYKSTIDEYTEYTNNPDKKASDSLHNLTKLNTVKPKPIKTFTRNIVEGDRSAEAQASWFKKPVVKPEYQSLFTPIVNEGERQMELRYKPTTTLAKGTLEQEVKPTMAKGKMESEPKPINELMMPDGTKWDREKFEQRYGKNQWLKAIGQKFENGGDMTTVYSNGGTHEQNPYGGIPIGDSSLVEEGEVRFDYKDKNKNLKSYIFSNKLKYKK